MARVRRYMSPDQMEIMSREHHEGRIIMIMSMVEVVVEGEEEEDMVVAVVDMVAVAAEEVMEEEGGIGIKKVEEESNAFDKGESSRGCRENGREMHVSNTFGRFDLNIRYFVSLDSGGRILHGIIW